MAKTSGCTITFPTRDHTSDDKRTIVKTYAWTTANRFILLAEPSDTALVGGPRAYVASPFTVRGTRRKGSTTRDEVANAFGELAQRWRDEIDPAASGVEYATSPAYQMIIGLGWPVVPLILMELQRQLDHWFWALRAITRHDPVAEEEVGDLVRMRDAWLAWGRDKQLC